MIEISIPGGATLGLKHLILDYNGTLALDGDLIQGVSERLKLLASQIEIHVLTADTHGTVREKVASIECLVHVIGEGAQDTLKADYLNSLGEEHTMAIGNGRNDTLMLRKAVLGVSVCQGEGMSPLAMNSSDICCTHINDALELLLNPSRLQATLRN